MMDNVPLKSPNDKLDYRIIELKNGLKALLISDPTTAEQSDEDDDGNNQDKGYESNYNNIDDKSDSSSGEESDEIDDEEEEEEEEDEDESEASEEDEDSNEESDNDRFGNFTDEEDESNDDSLKKNESSKQGEKLSAAGLCIGVGSFSDPDNIPGLAHFLEHMVFMGCEKYPDENYFDSFIYKHGGTDNASTDCERTVFHFEVHSKHFQESLERFAQFFIHPLMKQDTMDREMKAVDSEFQLSLPSDTYRKQQLRGSFAASGHPMRKFMWGSLNTLKYQPLDKEIDVHTELREFWRRYYSAHYMTLAVQSRETLDTLENWVRDYFSDIPNNGLPKPEFHHLSEPFATPAFYRLYKVIPVKNCLQVELHWALPSLMNEYRKKPLHYISNLIGHEGKGSILSYLKKKVWALSLFSGNDESGFEHNSTYSDYTIHVELTEEGFANVFEVITVIMQYIKMLTTVGPQQRIYSEFQTIEANDFRWLEEVEAATYVEELCENMQLYEPEDYIAGDQLMYEFDSKLIEKCQNLFSPDKCNIMLFSQTFEKENICIKTEPWYQIKYIDQDIPAEWLQKWKNLEPNKELYLPAVNIFIATDFEIKPADETYTEYPVVLIEDSHCRLWYKKDNKFNIPKAHMYFHLKSPEMFSSLESAVMIDLFVNILAQNLKEEAYPADVAQLSYSIISSEVGLIIKVDGFNDKLPILFETILDYIKNFYVTDDLFDAIKNYLRKTYYNSFIKPSSLCKGLRLSILQQIRWTTVDKRKIINTITVKQLLKFANDFKNSVFTEALIQGNMTGEEAKKMISLIQEKFNSKVISDPVVKHHIMQLPKGTTYCRVSSFNDEDCNSVVTNYYQSGPADIHQCCLMELLMMIMEEPCFDFLRTQEQLGYIVNCTCRVTLGILGFSVAVHTQADKFSCFHVDERIEAFLEHFREKLSTMAEKDFQTQVTSLVKLKQCVDLHLKEEVDRNWSEILLEYYVFDRLQKEVEHLKKLTLPELQQWYMQLILSGDGSKFRKLGTHVVGQPQNRDGLISHHKKRTTNAEIIRSEQTLGEDLQENRILDGKQKTIHDENKEYHLHFLEAKGEAENQYTIFNINEFKSGLKLYPFSQILE